MINLIQALEGFLGTKQDILASFPALLGNGQGIVDVPGEVNKVYVRVADQVQEVRCTRLTVRIDWLPIIVGTTAEAPNVTQVLSANIGVLNAIGYGLGLVTTMPPATNCGRRMAARTRSTCKATRSCRAGLDRWPPA